MRPRNYVVSDTLLVRALAAGPPRIRDRGNGGNASETIRWPEQLLVLPALWVSARLFCPRRRSSCFRHCRQRARAYPRRKAASASIAPTKATACHWRNPRTERKSWRRRRFRRHARCRRPKFRPAAIRRSVRSPHRSSATSTGAAWSEASASNGATSRSYSRNRHGAGSHNKVRILRQQQSLRPNVKSECLPPCRPHEAGGTF
jgi:hypothetical protein